MSSIDTERNVSNRIPVWEKMNLTIEEAVKCYTNVVTVVANKI